ncbi:RAP-1 related antigen (RRA), putative [Babesia bigemina]|uniref:RAP-1 related antigen (RRA), putative n=1 Tax=Babesia bigemina TaxID=5866 RepID=A0A061D100_BABBI|nr:RAP-1 related antigen (RRA), putative [Babesia bigemina]CDR94496.1 RAP-1 related antigen (RRA), putative [Babesia bigemina]|eukprot:XP_012766682.1 RAP-1 related antigen (RRA), putative [Babesia bigemina]
MKVQRSLALCLSALFIGAVSVVKQSAAVRNAVRTQIPLTALFSKVMHKINPGVGNVDHEQIIKERLVEIAMAEDAVEERVCERFADKDACQESVQRYLARCRDGKCMKLDQELHPLQDAEPTIHLPNTYQLEAAFRLFALLVADYRAENGVERIKVKSKMKSNLYRIFMKTLVHYNSSFKRLNATDTFLSRYLSTATLYYKTYTTLEPLRTALQNFSSIARYLCGKRIRMTLEEIVRHTANGAVKKTSAKYVVLKTADFSDYMEQQTNGYEYFSHHYANMTMDTLLKTMSDIVIESQKPWYVRMMRWSMQRVAIKLAKNPMSGGLLTDMWHEWELFKVRSKAHRFENFVGPIA